MKQSKMHLTVYGPTGYLGEEPAEPPMLPCGVKVEKPQTNSTETEVLLYTDGHAKLREEKK